MPFGGLAAIGIASAAPKLIAGVTQGIQAGRVKPQDTTPAAFREKLAMDRQAANSGQLPGLGVQQARLGMVQAGALKNARLGAASGSDFLAAAGAADSRRQAGEMQLGVMSQQYIDRARQNLGASLVQQAGYQQRDRDNYNREKAALTQASAENLNAAVDTAASYGAAGINQAADMAAPPLGATINSTAGMPFVPLGSQYVAPTAPTRLPGLYSADTSAYDLGALPGASPMLGLNPPTKPRRVGLGPAKPRIGL